MINIVLLLSKFNRNLNIKRIARNITIYHSFFVVEWAEMVEGCRK